MKVPKSHPRYISLKTRDLIADGVEKGITSIHGLIAHGRGEAFDYLLGEKTTDAAKKSIEAAAAMLLLAKNPVISVNGNAAVLVPKELVKLSNLLNAPLEVNIFHQSKQREIKIKKHLEKHGARNVLLPDKKYKIKFLESNRKYVNPHGILKADVVFVPLEDGDRAEALIKNGKKVVTIDLNPLSRTAQKATITIVDNITRAMPLLIKKIQQYKKYDNKKSLKQSSKIIKSF
ncbi:phosphopantothenate/pantothenate synthetase [Candidatus Woesearchaeota archaeon]|nr:phosphopantothenate/pantothenate synthetase [Candidatus Woesearchaeota archaeon]